MVLYALDGEFNLILIEEPENHLHPDFQKRMLSFLNTVEDRQFILSTHSTIFLNTSLTNKIYLARFKDDKIYIDDKTSRVEIFSEIGFWGTDNIVSDAIIITEGKNDHILMDYIFKHWYNIANTFSVSYVFLSGSMMAFFDPTPFAQLRNVFVLLDKDTKDKKPRDKFIKRCKSQNIFPTVLKRYSIENYYSFKGIKVVFKDLIKHQIIEIHKDIPLWEQLADADHSKQWWEGEVKSPQKMLPILKNMELKDIEGTDLDEFCKKIKKFSTE
jgi:Predicted ATP-dependent endonuclease of the OLD family